MKPNEGEEEPHCTVCGSVKNLQLNIHGLCPQCAKKVRIFEQERGRENIAFNSRYEKKEKS
jgi:hypothetical protein